MRDTQETFIHRFIFHAPEGGLKPSAGNGGGGIFSLTKTSECQGSARGRIQNENSQSTIGCTTCANANCCIPGEPRRHHFSTVTKGHPVEPNHATRERQPTPTLHKKNESTKNKSCVCVSVCVGGRTKAPFQRKERHCAPGTGLARSEIGFADFQGARRMGSEPCHCSNRDGRFLKACSRQQLNFLCVRGVCVGEKLRCTCSASTWTDQYRTVDTQRTCGCSLRKLSGFEVKFSVTCEVRSCLRE